MKGICCTCQEAHEVVRSAIGAAQDHYGVTADENDEGGWIMLPHSPTFSPEIGCEGTGMTPQSLIKG